MSAITFPPRPLKDLKPWGINTPTQTQEWLLAVQRTAAASIALFLILHYRIALQAHLSPVAVRVLPLVAGYCLSAPATFIGLGAFTLYNSPINLSRNLKDKNMTFVVINILGIAGAYVIVDTYKMKVPFLPSPNFLDKVFISRANKYCNSVYDRLFSR